MKTEHKPLNDAAEEIVRLRASKEKMEIRLTAIDDMLMLIAAQPSRKGGGMEMRSDIVSDIDEYLKENLDDLTQEVRSIVTKRKIR